MLVAFGACNKQELADRPDVKTGTTSTEENPVYQTAENVGIWHNACLDYLYDEFMPLKAENWTATEEEFDALLKEKIVEYFVLTGYPAPGTGVAAGSDFDPAALQSNEGKQLLSDIEDGLSKYEADLLTLEGFQETMNLIQLQAAGLETEEEQYVIAATAAVLKYSSLYWAAEGLKYEDFYAGVNRTKANPAQIATLKADGVGAFWGAFGGPISSMFTSAYKSSVEAFRQKGYDCWFCP